MPPAAHSAPDGDLVQARPEPAVLGMNTDDGMSVPVGRRSGRGTGRNLVISLGVLVIPLLVLVWFFQPRTIDSAPPVDATGVYRTAIAMKAFHVREPSGLQGATPIGAVFSPATGGRFTVRVSYSLPGGTYLQLVQSNAPADSLITSIIDQGEPLGTEQIAGETWTHYTARGGAENSFILLRSDVTVVVVGDASLSTVRTMIRALR